MKVLISLEPCSAFQILDQWWKRQLQSWKGKAVFLHHSLPLHTPLSSHLITPPSSSPSLSYSINSIFLIIITLHHITDIQFNVLSYDNTILLVLVLIIATLEEHYFTQIDGFFPLPSSIRFLLTLSLLSLTLIPNTDSIFSSSSPIL